MSRRTDRLKKVLLLQEKLEELHKTRQAGHAAGARSAEAEAADLVQAFNAPDSLSAVFPDLYHARVASAGARKQQHLANAHLEAMRVAKASARGDAVRRQVVISRRADDRAEEERDRTEALTRSVDQGK